MIRKYITLKSILFIMFANLKLVLRSYTSLYGIFMSASLTLFIYIFNSLFLEKKTCILLHLKYYMQKPFTMRTRSIVDGSLVHCHGACEVESCHGTLFLFCLFFFCFVFIFIFDFILLLIDLFICRYNS